MAYGKPFQQLSIKDSIQEAKENKIINKGLKIKYYLKNNLQINFKIIPFNKIYNELKKYIESEELHFDYRQRPKLYCFDKYGDLELYDFILYIIIVKEIVILIKIWFFILMKKVLNYMKILFLNIQKLIMNLKLLLLEKLIKNKL